jgi:hypothetical protein
MRNYHKERDAFDEYQNRCTRNMPIKTNTIGTDRVIDYAEDSPTPKHWQGFKVTEEPVRNMSMTDLCGWIGVDKAHDKGDETATMPVGHVDVREFLKDWPTEERINNIGQNGPTGEHYMNKYQRKLTNPEGAEIVIDVYDVLNAYPSGCPPIDHAIKKLLCTGRRGAKDWETDLQEAIDSLERAKSFPPLPF